jgi:hypothetical protein
MNTRTMQAAKPPQRAFARDRAAVRLTLLLASVATLLAATFLSRVFTWACYPGHDWLLLVRRGNILVEVITQRHHPQCDWHEICYPAPQPAWGLQRNASSGLDWNCPRIQENYVSTVGTWWEVRMPTWLLLLVLALVPLRSLVSRRRARTRLGHRALHGASAEMHAGRRPWSRGARVLAIVSASLTVALGALWIANLWCTVAWFDGKRELKVSGGELIARIPSQTEVFYMWDSHPGWDWWSEWTPRAVWKLPRTTDMFQSTIGPWTETIVPFWLLVIVSAAPGLVLLWHHRRQRAPGSCRRCGYDLTGNVSGICPECGATTGNQPNARALQRPGDDTVLQSERTS